MPNPESRSPTQNPLDKEEMLEECLKSKKYLSIQPNSPGATFLVENPIIGYFKYHIYVNNYFDRK